MISGKKNIFNLTSSHLDSVMHCFLCKFFSYPSTIGYPEKTPGLSRTNQEWAQAIQTDFTRQTTDNFRHTSGAIFAVVNPDNSYTKKFVLSIRANHHEHKTSRSCGFKLIHKYKKLNPFVLADYLQKQQGRCNNPHK